MEMEVEVEMEMGFGRVFVYAKPRVWKREGKEVVVVVVVEKRPAFVSEKT